MNVALNVNLLEEVVGFKYLGLRIAIGGGVKEEVKFRMHKEEKMCGGMKQVLKYTSLGINVNRLLEGVMAQTSFYGAKTCNMEETEEEEIEWNGDTVSRELCVVLHEWFKGGNEEMQNRTGVVIEMAD